jgi:phosphatidylserine decarboxylase
MMKVCREVNPFLAASVLIGAVVAFLCRLLGAGFNLSIGSGLVVALVLAAYMLFFFRDPERNAPQDDSIVVAGADGVVAVIREMREEKVMQAQCIRISIFLSLFNVHVNRAPIRGLARFLGYFPGRRYFTFQEKSSEFNQHNAILYTGRTRCLMYQIVGPVCRRVVYWPDHDREVELKQGDRIGMMKFGSRMDMYLPANEVELLVKQGDIVRAGLTPVARIIKKE